MPTTPRLVSIPSPRRRTGSLAPRATAGAVADEEWREADWYDPNTDNLNDDIIEVIDLRTNRVIASQRFDHSFHLIEAGLLGRLDITANGSVRYQTFRVQLEAAAGGG